MGKFLWGLFHRMQEGIAWGEKILGTVAMAFIVLINIYGILSRYVLNTPVIYVQELTILAGVWLFFIGMGLVFKVHADITVEFLVEKLPRRAKLLNEIFVDLLILFFTVVLAWQTYQFLPYTRTASNVLSFALELPDEIYYYPIGFGAISIFLTVFDKLVQKLQNFSECWGEA